ncbi:MAG: EAL domain-containing protein, partial [Sphaerochaeta associata]|uniref:putative bifunctional diguanylate cyclase/phosphodiesterase n=1 Tax=Sphaerochaeta associata TaxID=1129264 RepID=UPI002B215E39
IGITLAHMLAIPTYILFWMRAIERRLLHPETARILERVQFSLLGLAAIVTFSDLVFKKLFIFSDAGRFIEGSGLLYMHYLSTLFILVQVVVLFSCWRRIPRYIRTLFLFSSIFLILSLIFFQWFRQPYLLGISSTFMLLLSYLVWQRRELTLDLLTRIPNYTAYLEHLKHVVRTAQETTILMLDIENFRLINDRYGNAHGDVFLQRFATKLETSIPSGPVFRLFGNRFAIILPHQSHNGIVRIVKDIRSIANEGFLIEEMHISCHVNIAIVETPLKTNTVEEIVESLDYTMAEIKERRRLSVIIFNQKLVPLRQRKLDVLSVLRRAVVKESMVKVLYQPIIATKDNHIIAAEALMRIEDDRLGMISPGEFIPAAEMAGLISPLTEIIIRKVSTFLKNHEQQASHLSHISINISADDLHSAEFARRILDIIEQTKVDAGKLSFEVTESMLLSPSDSVHKNWNAFTERGIHFLLDDFGTGYSNLTTLVSKPFDFVKLDRSLVSNATNNYELLSLITGMLKHLGLSMVAEGVETKEQLEVVMREGIQFVQGYYFSKPVSEEQFLKWLSGSMCIIPKK